MMSDIYLVVYLATTCDDSSAYVNRDSTELIEFVWAAADASTLNILHQDSVLVRPVNTPITSYCSRLHKITWEHVRNAGTFRDAITRFDEYVQKNIIQKELEFSFVTLDISKLKVQLPREARDKSVVLPSYLQHPKVFDLQSEYTKWQLTHPEALSYSSSSLIHIMAALEIEAGLEKNTIYDDSDLQESPSSATPPSLSSSTTSFTLENSNSRNGSSTSLSLDTKAKSTVRLYTKLLTQIIKKSLPPNEHPSVLTSPYDSYEDIKMFFNERSKILFLSNVPHDVIQSELESWFTQYGGNPVAFWSLRNSESVDKFGFNGYGSNSTGKTISGFVVFANHEEAAESLSMNGRVLNDKPIEVQPSSTKVLDKASDLLTPFPSSKNRPRPGDWTCPSCGFSNFQRRTACFRCSFPATSAVAIQESIYPSSGLGGRRSGMQGRANSNDKVSHNSTMVSPATNQTYSNGYSDNSPYAGPNGNSHMGHQQISNNNHHHGNNGNRSNYGYNVPFRAGDWKCSNESCRYHNFAKNLCCLKCGGAKPTNSYNNHQGMNHLHSVNSAAAVIAAATASGQPLNLNNNFMGLQQPQPHQAQRQSHHPGSTSVTFNNTKSSNLTPQYPHQNGGFRETGNDVPQSHVQLLPQHLMLMQQQQQQATSHAPSSGLTQKYSQSVSNSPGLYSGMGLQKALNQQQYPYNNVSNASHSGPIVGLGDPSDATNPHLQNLSPSFGLLTKSIDSLSLNNH